MQNKNKIIEVLNDLVLINNDRIAGYERAIKESKPGDTDLRQLYKSMIAESHNLKIQLGQEIEALGADMEKGTTTSGKIYRAWMDVKAVFTGHDRHTVLANCEAGEDAAQRAYQEALQHEGIPAYIREMLVRQQDLLRESHDEIKDLRDEEEEVTK